MGRPFSFQFLSSRAERGRGEAVAANYATPTPLHSGEEGHFLT